MSFWDKFFKPHKGPDEENFSEEDLMPIEKFVKKFTENNGKFFLVESLEEIPEVLNRILEYEQKQSEDEKLYWTANPDIYNNFSDKLPFSHENFPQRENIVLSFAKYLIENIGGITFTSYETGDFRLIDLPKIMVFLATPDQLLANKEKAMQNINKEYKNFYPAHIQTINHFSSETSDYDSAKKVYLILYV